MINQAWQKHSQGAEDSTAWKATGMWFDRKWTQQQQDQPDQTKATNTTVGNSGNVNRRQQSRLLVLCSTVSWLCLHQPPYFCKKKKKKLCKVSKFYSSFVLLLNTSILAMILRIHVCVSKLQYKGEGLEAFECRCWTDPPVKYYVPFVCVLKHSGCWFCNQRRVRRRITPVPLQTSLCLEAQWVLVL